MNGICKERYLLGCLRQKVSIREVMAIINWRDAVHKCRGCLAKHKVQEKLHRWGSISDICNMLACHH